jgi:hypothetical protein
MALTTETGAKRNYMKGFLFWPDVEYSDPGGLQEKLERLNHIMSGDWDHASRRAPYLNQCKLMQITVEGLNIWWPMPLFLDIYFICRYSIEIDEEMILHYFGKGYACGFLG